MTGQGGQKHFALDWYAEGVTLGLTELLIREDNDLLPRLARRLKDLLNEISGTASQVGSTQMLSILERLQFTAVRALELPCCLVVAEFDGDVAAHRCADQLTLQLQDVAPTDLRFPSLSRQSYPLSKSVLFAQLGKRRG